MVMDELYAEFEEHCFDNGLDHTDEDLFFMWLDEHYDLEMVDEIVTKEVVQ